MSKRLRTSIFLMLGVLILIFMMVGCNKTPVVNSSYIQVDNSPFTSNKSTKALIEDREELFSFFVFVEGDFNTVSNYDDVFFKDNSLVIFKIVEESKENKSEIKSYKIKKGTITVNLETVSRGKDNVPATYYFILELEKKEADSITQINIVKNGELLLNKVDETEYNDFVKQFDVSEEKKEWQQSDDIDYLDCALAIEFKKTSTYPEFKLEYLGIDEAVAFGYIEGPQPEEFDDSLYEEYLKAFRQTIFVYLNSQGREKIVDVIRKIEKLDFVYSVSITDLFLKPYTIL